MTPKKKRSKKTLSNVCIHFTELKLTLHCPVWKLCFWGIFEVLLRGAAGLVVSKETTSDENWRETFRAAALWCVYSSHSSTSFFGLSSLKSMFLWNLRKNIWERSLEYAEKEISSYKNQKETFCESALGHIKPTRTVKLPISLSSILTLFYVNQLRDNRELFEASGENGNVFR